MPAVNVLTSKGWAVQLSHDPAEPAGQDHGFILIKDAAGTVFVDCPDFQHNRQDFYMAGWEKQLAEVLSPVPEAANGGADCAASGEKGLTEASADPKAAGA